MLLKSAELIRVDSFSKANAGENSRTLYTPIFSRLSHHPFNLAGTISVRTIDSLID